VSEDQED